MTQTLASVAAVMVAAALVAIACYGCITIALTVLTAARPRRVDPLAEEVDAFLADLLGPRDQPSGRGHCDAADPGRSGPGTTPGRRGGPIG